MKKMLRGLCAALAACAMASAGAQTWPAKPVRIVAPYAAGGTNDIAARILAERLSQRLGQQFVVENKPGANTRIATEFVAKSAPDGYTLFFCAAPHSTNPGLYGKLPYDTVKDFAPIVHAVTVPLFFLVPSASPVKNTKELIELAKKDPSYANVGSPGNGSAPHLAIELLNSVSGATLTHIPYKGDAPGNPGPAGRTPRRLGRPDRARAAAYQGRASCARFRWPARSATQLCPTCPRSPNRVFAARTHLPGSACSPRPERRPR